MKFRASTVGEAGESSSAFSSRRGIERSKRLESKMLNHICQVMR